MHLHIFFLIAAFAALFHFILIRYAHVLGLVDVPNERSMHKKVIPRGAGIAIFMSVMLVQSIFNWDHIFSNLYLYAAITFVFIIGFLDDVYDVSPRYKFVFIFFAAILVYLQGIQIDTLGSYFGYEIALHYYLIFPFMFIAIAGFTNALNLIDGLDGLSASVSLIILVTFFAIGFNHDDLLIMTISSSFIAALIVFWLFNWFPAKIFMGDSGSLTLGFIISVLSILSFKYTSPTAILFIIALPLLDTFMVMTRRIQRGESPFKADKNHLHHFVYGVKVNVPVAVVLLASIQAVFSIIGYQLQGKDDFLSLVLFGLLFFTFLNLFDQRLRHRKKAKKAKKQRQGKKGRPIIRESGMPEAFPTPIIVKAEPQ